MARFEMSILVLGKVERANQSKQESPVELKGTKRIKAVEKKTKGAEP